MRNATKNLGFLAAFSAALLLTAGCKGFVSGQADVTPSASPTGSMYTGQTLPSKVDLLSGTPYYANSEKMAAAVKLDGAPFLIMAPQEPTKALLVLESGTAPSEVKGRPSELRDFSGVTETIEAPGLITMVKDDLGLDLKTDESGKVVMLKIAKGAPIPAGASTPAASGSPASATPGATP